MGGGRCRTSGTPELLRRTARWTYRQCRFMRRGEPRCEGAKLWPLMALGKGTAKALVSSILLDGAPVREGDIDGWRQTTAVIANAVRQREVRARWDAFAREIGAPAGINAKSAVDLAEKILRICDEPAERRSYPAALGASAGCPIPTSTTTRGQIFPARSTPPRARENRESKVKRGLRPSIRSPPQSRSTRYLALPPGSPLPLYLCRRSRPIKASPP